MTNKAFRTFANELMNREDREELLEEILAYIGTQKVALGDRTYSFYKIQEEVINRRFKSVKTTVIVLDDTEMFYQKVVGVMEVVSTANNLNKDRIRFSNPRNITFREATKADGIYGVITGKFQEKFPQFNHLLHRIFNVTNGATNEFMRTPKVEDMVRLDKVVGIDTYLHWN